MTLLLAALLAASAGVMIDLDTDGFDATVDCDDGNPAMYPGAPDPCEPFGTDQLDNDCDGNPNTKDGVYLTDAATGGTLPLNALGWFHPDADLDGFGADGDRTALCELTFEISEGREWRRSGDDCDDTDADVNALAVEICDERDNNCNTLIDEPEPNVPLTPDADPSCVWHHPDLDADGFGARDTTDRLCLCEGLETLTASGTVPHPTTCATPVSATEVAYGHLLNGVCFVPSDTDCDDQSAAVKPRVPGTTPTGDYLAPVDLDCDGEVPLAALDCDGDGAVALPPVASAQLIDAPWSTSVSAFELGLQTCNGRVAPALECSGWRAPARCDEATGLWVVPMTFLQEIDRSLDGVYLLRDEDSTCLTWDCDDTCPARCVGAAEACDGLDNDCAGAVDAALAGTASLDDDGVPDTMKASSVDPGLLHPAELDIDGEGGVRCEGLDLDNASEPGPVADCVALVAVAPPEEEISVPTPDPTEPASSTCGCDGGAPGLLWAWPLVPALLWRRRR